VGVKRHGGTPPRLFWEKRRLVVENKEWEAEKENKERPKRRQVTGNARLEAECSNRKRGEKDLGGVYPRGICMDVKTRDWGEKGFVRI